MSSAGNGRDLSVGGTVSMPLYSGGRVRNGVRAANTRVEAGRADLRATEGDIFTEAVAAYMDVIRDRSIVQLNQNQVRVLETNLQATRDRFEVGDLTRTDVAQSDARLALARSSLAIAEGRLRGERGELPPRDRRAARAICSRRRRCRRCPATPDQATEIALANNADLASIAAQARAAGYDVRVARGERLPTISAISSDHAISTRSAPADEAGGAPPGIAAEQHHQRPASACRSACRSTRAAPPARASARRRPSAASCSSRRSAVERLVVSNTRAAFASYQAALRGDRIERDRGRRQPARARRHPRRADGRHPQRPRRAQRRAGIAEQPGAARHRPARRLCRRLPAAQRDGRGRGRGSQPRRRRRSTTRWSTTTAIRAAGPTGTTGRRSAPVSTRTAPPGSTSPVTQPPVTAPPQ